MSEPSPVSGTTGAPHTVRPGPCGPCRSPPGCAAPLLAPPRLASGRQGLLARPGPARTSTPLPIRPPPSATRCPRAPPARPPGVSAALRGARPPLPLASGPGHMRGFLLALCSVTPLRASPASCGAQTPATAERGAPVRSSKVRMVSLVTPARAGRGVTPPRAPTPAAREPARSPPGSRASRLSLPASPPRPAPRPAVAPLPHSPAQPCLAPGVGAAILLAAGRRRRAPDHLRPRAARGLAAPSPPRRHRGCAVRPVPPAGVPPGPSAHICNDSSHFCSLFSLCSAAHALCSNKTARFLVESPGRRHRRGAPGGRLRRGGGRRHLGAAPGRAAGRRQRGGRGPEPRGLLGLGCLQSPDTPQQEEGQQEEPRAGGEAGLGPSQPVR